MLAEILGGGLTGRLYQKLVVSQKLAVNVGAHSDSSRLDNGEFIIYALPAPQVDFAELARAVDDEQYGRCARCDWRLELDALVGAKTMRNRDVSASRTR